MMAGSPQYFNANQPPVHIKEIHQNFFIQVQKDEMMPLTKDICSSSTLPTRTRSNSDNELDESTHTREDLNHTMSESHEDMSAEVTSQAGMKSMGQ
jgi:hypothetical protein